MGYNITRIEVRRADGFGVFSADLPKLMDPPDSWVMPPREPSSSRHPWETDEAGFATLRPHEGGIVSFPWHGPWSGQVFDVLRDQVLPCFRGYAELFIVWEDGDSFSALRCDHGKVTEHNADWSLGGAR